MPRRARVSRYHSNRARGSSSSANRLTGARVADQIADTTSYEPMWHETTITPLPTARACSRYSRSLASRCRSGRIASTFMLGSIIRSAYALAWLRKFSRESSFNPDVVTSGHATFRLYASRGRASGENHQATRAAMTASAYAHVRGNRSTSDWTILNARQRHSLTPEHRPECVPLIRTLRDEHFESIHDPLHHMLFGLTFTDGERRVEFDLVPTWRRHVLASGHQRVPGLDRQVGGATRYHATTAEESD